MTNSSYYGVSEIPDGSVSHNGNAEQVWIEYSFSGSSTISASWQQLQQGGDGFFTIIHELGHALGLAHPHDGGGQPDKTKFPGMNSSGSSGTNGQNQGPFTVMSYITGLDGMSPSLAYGTVGSYSTFDIAAFQALYGVNTDYRTGSDAYTLPSTNGVGTYWYAIWDAGGVDEISAAGSSTAAVIDLRAAPLIGTNAGGYISRIGSVSGGFTIAQGVLIENATGGAGDDTLIGNAAANALQGGTGADTMTGGAGGDSYFVDGLGDTVTEAAGGGREWRHSPNASLTAQHWERPTTACGTVAVFTWRRESRFR